MSDNPAWDDSMWDPRPRPGGDATGDEVSDGGADDRATSDEVTGDDVVAVLVELDGGDGSSPMAITTRARHLGKGFELDEEFEVTPMGGGSSYVVHGWVPSTMIERLQELDDVREVWRDTPIAPFCE